MSPIGSTLFYFVTFFISALFVFLGNSSRKRIVSIGSVRINCFIVLALLVPILVGVFRYGLGTDYAAYLEIYQYHADGTVINNNANYARQIEVLFQWLAQISYNLTKTPILFFGVPWLSTVILTYYGMRRLARGCSASHLSAIWFVILSVITPIGFNQVRQAMAMAIMFFAVSFLTKRKRYGTLKYLMLAFFAGACHKSAIVIMVSVLLFYRLVFLRKRKAINPQKLFRLVLVISPLLIAVFLAIMWRVHALLPENYGGVSYLREFYRLWFFFDSGKLIDLRPENIITSILFIPSLFVIFKSKKINSEHNIQLSSLLCCIGFALSLLSLFVMNGERISQYFILFAPIAFFSSVPVAYTRVVLSAYGLAVFVFVMFFGWQSVTYYHTVFQARDVDLNIVNQRRVRALYSQIVCASGLQRCRSLTLYDASARSDGSVYEYSKGELWQP